MVKISVVEDCGNAPKKQFVQDFIIACANADIDSAMKMLTENVSLVILGYKSAQGPKDVKVLLLHDANQSKVAKLTIHNILSHGGRCAANGLLEFEDGGHVAFCSMYAFDTHGKNAKLESITTYSIVLK